MDLPELPGPLTALGCQYNNIYCIPKLPSHLEEDPELPVLPRFRLSIDSGKIQCIANYPAEGLDCDKWGTNPSDPYVTSTLPLCNPTNNPSHCASFPVMAGTVFYDQNGNDIMDNNEQIKKNAKVLNSGNQLAFTNNNGYYETPAPDTGTYNISIIPPRYFTAYPASFTYHFTNNDTMVVNDFALRANTTIDELTLHITPLNWAARPGFSFPYLVSYENTGTTTVSPNIVFDYDQARLNYNTSSVAGVVDNASTLSYNSGTLAPGESGSFTGYFTLKTTVPLGDTINAKATITANSFVASDSVRSFVQGSFDPNDKQATPQLSPSQVANGDYIDYTIRFQNTGTDTAFNVVISDTLSSDLQANTLQMTGASHTCKTTVQDNVVFFELLNILLPDSNVNESKSHGFVSFRIKPQPTVAANATISNRAAIYFDYNAPVITNTAGTLIKDFVVLPLKLVAFTAVPQNDNTTSLYWSTANEINTKQFVIERSYEGSRFSTMATVPAKGRMNNDYSAAVSDAHTTTIFYRLKMMDADGQYSYSPVIKIDSRKSNAGISILSNPVKEAMIISCSDRTLVHTSASIINQQGAVVKTFLLKEGDQAVNIDNLPPGIYYLRAISGSSRFVLNR